MKILFHIFITLLLCSSLTTAQEAKINKLNDEIKKITEIQAGFKDLHSELLSVKMQCDDLNMKAKINQNNNLLKTYLKGLKDTYSLITDGPSSLFEAAKGAIENLYIEPYFSKARKVKIDFEKFKIERSGYTEDVKKMYAALTLMLNSDLKYFDDDMPTSVYTKKYWKAGDGQPDDEAELCTRKLHVLIGLSKDLSDKIGTVTKQIRADYLTLDNVKDENKKFINILEKELKVNNDIRARQKKRMEEFAKAEAFAKTEEKAKAEGKQDNYSREGDERDSKFMAQMIGRENKALADYIKKGYAIGKNANVSFTVDPGSKLISGWSVLMIADLKPAEALGELVWKVDDFVVGHNDVTTSRVDARKFAYIFDTPGIYDVSVTFEVEGKYVDQYLTQLKIEPNAVQKGKEKSFSISVFNPNQPLKLKKSSKDKRVQIMDLPFAKYWVSGAEKQEIISGYYLNGAGKKNEYTSLKIADYNPAIPVYGLFGLRSFNGYHVYRTFENDKPVLIITLLGQNGPAEFKRVDNVAKFEVKLASDLSKATVSYKTTGGSSSAITLE